MNRHTFVMIALALGWLSANSADAVPIPPPSPGTPPFVVNGTNVTTPNASGPFNHSHFTDTSTGYSVLVAPISGQALMLTNAGSVISVGDSSTVTIQGLTTLTSNNNVAVIKIAGNGSVTTSSGVTINGYDAIDIAGVGTVNNSATITASDIGIQVKSGTIINYGTVTGGSGPALTGVGAGTTTIVNYGTLLGQYGAGSNADLVLNNSGLIRVSSIGVGAQKDATVTNSGSIISTGGYGLQLQKDATVTNSGLISGKTVGIAISNTGLIVNSGTITGKSAGLVMDKGSVTNQGTISSASEAVVINNGGSVINSGTITGTNSAIAINGKTGTVSNTGKLISSKGVGVYLGSGGSLTNSGAISAFMDGVQANDPLTILNSGSITSSKADGIDATKGSLTNSGNISGAKDGVVFSDAATITNSGQIAGLKGTGISIGKQGTVLLAGGSVSSSKGAAILVNTNGGDKSSISIVGRALLTTPAKKAIVSKGKTGSLTLNLVGMTPAEAAAINAMSGQKSGNIMIGSYNYSWKNLVLSAHAVSLEQVVDPGLVDIATRIDNVNQGLSSAYDPLYVAAANNPEAALNSFTGREFLNAFSQVGLSSATTLGSLADGRSFSIRSGADGGVDFGGLDINSSDLLASLDNVQNVLTRLSISDMAGATMSDSHQAMFSHGPDQPWGVWASGAVTIANDSGSFSNPAYHTTAGSPTIGFDYHLFPEFVVGGLVNYTTTGSNFSDGSQLNATTVMFGGYADWLHNNWFVNGLVAGGFNNYSQSRNTLGGTVAQASPGGSEVISNVSGGYDFKFGSWMISPEAGLDYTHLEKDAFSETGAGAFDLNVGEQDINSLRTNLGFNVANSFKWDGMKFAPELHASWYHECLNNTNGVSTSLPGAPALGNFIVTTTPSGRDFALTGASLSITPNELNDRLTFFLAYDAQVGQANYIAHTVDGGLRIGF